ncbi:MAG: glycosyltransferase, partial [Phycisphaerales bacterium]
MKPVQDSSHEQPDPFLTLIAPARNEVENLPALVEEVSRVMGRAAVSWEFIVIDDGSTDGSRARLIELMQHTPQLRALTVDPQGRGVAHGQSAAFMAGFRAARGKLIALLDADLQNDPADLLAMLEAMDRSGADLVQGDRMHDRRDTVVRQVSSLVGRFFRLVLLGDTIRDTGCSLRIMKRETALALPLQFKGMHRFIPITARQLGYTVIEVPVKHRPRTAGRAKYGIWNRALPGLIDC